jgi:hypothetical protein
MLHSIWLAQSENMASARVWYCFMLTSLREVTLFHFVDAVVVIKWYGLVAPFYEVIDLCH